MREDRELLEVISNVNNAIPKLRTFAQKINILEKTMSDIKLYSKEGLTVATKESLQREISAFYAEESAKIKNNIAKENKDALYFAGAVNEVLKVLKEQDVIDKVDLTSVINETLECASYSSWRRKMEDGRTDRSQYYQQKGGR